MPDYTQDSGEFLRECFCTIISSNYYKQAAVLVDSFKKSGNRADFYVLVTDIENKDDLRIPQAATLTLNDLNKILEIDDLSFMSKVYDVVEFATAMKPFLLKKLLQDYQIVTYIDPDVKVFGKFEETSLLALKHGIVLTPHRLTPSESLESGINELHFLKYGIFNLGFISISGASNSMLDWWAARLTRHATRYPFDHVFTDQKWINFVPVLFNSAICKNPGLNVAPWNLDERDLIKKGDEYFVDGHKLIFIHFSQMSGQLASGKTPNHWSQNFFTSNCKHSRLTEINNITEIYKTQLAEVETLVTKKKINFSAPWIARKKAIYRNNLDILNKYDRHRIYSRFIELLLKSEVATSIFTYFPTDLRKLFKKLLKIGGKRSDFLNPFL